MLFQLKLFLRSLLLPPAGPLLLGIIGVALIRFRPRIGHLLITLSLVSLWLLATPAVGFAIYRLAETYPAIILDKPIDAQAIVILSGGGARGDSPAWAGPYLVDTGWDRLAYGVALSRRTGLPVLITGTDLEARSGRNMLEVVFGIEARWVDDGSGNTWESAQHTARLLHEVPVSRIVLVTHSNHMGRAADEFEAAGFSVLPAPVVVAPRAGPNIYAWLPSATGIHYANIGLYELIGRPLSSILRRWRS